MIIAIVADETIPAEDWSRDPHVLAAELRARGHRVTLLLVTAAAGPPPHRPAPDGYLAPLPAAAGHGLDVLTARPDVVLSAGPAAPPVAAVLADSLGAPLALLLPPELSATHPPAPGYARLLCRHLPAALLLAESARQAAAAERAGADPRRTFVVPPGIRIGPPARSPGRGPDDPLRLLCDVTRTPPDGQAFVARVLTRVAAERGHRIHTTILSTAEPSTEVKEVWAGRPETTVTEAPGPAALPALYDRCDVAVAPSAATDETAALLRAMAAGRALIAADCPPVRDVVHTTRNGILARVGNEDEWLDKLDYLLEGGALRLHIGRGARARAETHFSLPQTLHRLEERLAALTASWNYGGG